MRRFIDGMNPIGSRTVIPPQQREIIETTAATLWWPWLRWLMRRVRPAWGDIGSLTRAVEERLTDN